MILDSKWNFELDWDMPDNTTDVCDGYIDWQAGKNKDWINTSIPRWVIVTCDTVPSAGTSLQVLFYQHSGTTLTDGDLLLSGRVIARADLSADPADPGHWLFCVPLMSCLCSVQAADRDRYCGPVLSASGTLTAGVCNAFLWLGANPPVPVARPDIVGGSNIVMPS